MSKRVLFIDRDGTMIREVPPTPVAVGSRAGRAAVHTDGTPCTCPAMCTVHPGRARSM